MLPSPVSSVSNAVAKTSKVPTVWEVMSKGARTSLLDPSMPQTKPFAKVPWSINNEYESDTAVKVPGFCMVNWTYLYFKPEEAAMT